MGTPDVGTVTRLNNAVKTKGTGCLFTKHNEDEESPNKLSTFVTYVPVTMFKNLQAG